MFERSLKLFKSTTRRFSKTLIWICSILLTIILLIQIAAFGGVMYLNSQSGQDLIKAQVITAAKDAGYEVNFTSIGYSFPQGLRLSEFEISDAQDKIAELDDLVIRPGLLALGIKHLNLSISADTFTLYRLPTSEKKDVSEEETPFALSPFELPDIYFTQLALNNLSVNKLDIRKEVFGLALILSPSLDSRIELGEEIEADLNLYAEKVDEDLPIWMPREIELQANFNPQTLALDLKNLEISRPAIEINASGQADLSENGALDFTLNIDADDFSELAENVDGDAEVSAKLQGNINAPSLNAEGVINMPMLEERGLDAIEFNIVDDNITTPPLGSAEIKTVYDEKPITLAADFNLADGILALDNIKGSAPELSVEGEIDVNTDTLLAEGALNVSANDLGVYSRMVNIPLKGNANATLELSGNEGAQSLSAKTTIKDAAYQDITLQSADLTANISDIRNPWPDQFTLKATGFRPAADVVFNSLDAALNQKDGEIYGLSLKANGNALQEFSVNGGADLQGIKTGQVSAENIDLTLSSKGSAIKVTGKANQEALDIKANTKGFNLSSLPVSLPAQLEDVRLEADIHAHGMMNAPIIEGTAGLTPVSVVDGASLTITGTGGYKDGNARIDLNGKGDAVEQLDGFVQLPMRLSLLPFELDLPQSTPLDGQITLAAQAGSLAPLFLPAGHELQGGIGVNGTIGGTLATPDIRGSARLSDGTYFFTPYGVELYDLNMNADLTQQGVVLNNLSANGPEGGKLNANGTFDFNEKQNTDLQLQLVNFKLADSEKLKGIFSADLELAGQSDSYLLAGDINLGQFDIIIPERFKSNIPELNIVEEDEDQSQKEHLTVVNLDMNIIADNQIFVRGWGLDAEFGGQVNIDGTLASPLFNGDLSARRGRYEEFGRRFNLDRAVLRFQGTIPPSPYLDIVATTDADDVEASVNLSGGLDDPQLKLSSVPSLPEDEILSRVLFGKNMSNITPFQAIKLKQTLDRFSGQGGGGFDPLGKLRDLTGLDDIRVDTDDEGNASVGAGKYLSEGVYLELEKGAGEQSGAANVQVEVTPSITLESEVGQDAQAGAGVMWKWDY